MSEKNISIIIGGDFVPIGDGISLFEAGNAEGLVGRELLDIIHEADFSVFNLEVPLVDVANPIPKCGPNLIAPTNTIAGLTAINPYAFALANNHILDQGDEGLVSTIETLDTAGVVHFGAGINLGIAKKPYVFEKYGYKVGFYACAEHEFTIATELSPGANPFDPLESLDHIASLKAECDYVVVFYHGGKEHYRYPSPMLQKTCRKIAEKGADLVVCQHSHCVGCQEIWNSSTIIYGQGNFLFDNSESEFWQTGLLLRVGISVDKMSVEYLPLRKHGLGVRFAESEDAERILDDFMNRSIKIMGPDFVEVAYAAFAEEKLEEYLKAFIPGSRTLVFRILHKLSCYKLIRLSTNSRRRLEELNYLQCESHKELFIKGLSGNR